MAGHALSARDDEADCAADVRSNLQSDLVEDLNNARYKPFCALYGASSATNENKFPLLSDWWRVAMSGDGITICDAMGSNERLFASYVPRFYWRHTAQVLFIRSHD